MSTHSWLAPPPPSPRQTAYSSVEQHEREKFHSTHGYHYPPFIERPIYRVAFIDHPTKPCSNLPRFDRISLSKTRTINLRQRSIALDAIAGRFCNNPRSFVEAKNEGKTLFKKSSQKIFSRSHFGFIQFVP